MAAFVFSDSPPYGGRTLYTYFCMYEIRKAWNAAGVSPKRTGCVHVSILVPVLQVPRGILLPNEIASSAHQQR